MKHRCKKCHEHSAWAYPTLRTESVAVLFRGLGFASALRALGTLQFDRNFNSRSIA